MMRTSLEGKHLNLSWEIAKVKNILWGVLNIDKGTSVEEDGVSNKGHCHCFPFSSDA